MEFGIFEKQFYKIHCDIQSFVQLDICYWEHDFSLKNWFILFVNKCFFIEEDEMVTEYEDEMN